MNTNTNFAEIIYTNLRRYTFENKKMKKWVEENCNIDGGITLNLFSGKTALDLVEIRNDIDETMPADFHKDAFEFVRDWKGPLFSTIVLDPPYSYRKSMEMYKGNKVSKFKLIADNANRILAPGGRIISFGYHSTFMGNKRGYYLNRVCNFMHGGAQHLTTAIVEKRISE